MATAPLGLTGILWLSVKRLYTLQWSDTYLHEVFFSWINIMWASLIGLLMSTGAYFFDIGVDILVGREQISKTFPDYKFKGFYEVQ